MLFTSMSLAGLHFWNCTLPRAMVGGGTAAQGLLDMLFLQKSSGTCQQAGLSGMGQGMDLSSYLSPLCLPPQTPPDWKGKAGMMFARLFAYNSQLKIMCILCSISSCVQSSWEIIVREAEPVSLSSSIKTDGTCLPCWAAPLPTRQHEINVSKIIINVIKSHKWQRGSSSVFSTPGRRGRGAGEWLEA